MTPEERQEWDRWVARHSKLFGIFEPRLVEMLVAWTGIFPREQFTPADLVAASEELALNPPRFANEHLAALLGVARGHRSKRFEASRCREPAPGNDPRCPLCADSGWCSVPHLQPAYRARRYTFAVYCDCPRGQRLFHNHAGSDVRGLTLTQYEQHVADWEEIQRNWKDMDREVRAHQGNADLLVETMGRLRAKVEHRHGSK